jgi:hypothetical protein
MMHGASGMSHTRCSKRTNNGSTNAMRTIMQIGKPFLVYSTNSGLRYLGLRTHYLLSALNGRAFPGGRKVDYLYVDEVQDNLIIDIACPLALLF